jgi:hypothetical protein
MNRRSEDDGTTSSCCTSDDWIESTEGSVGPMQIKLQASNVASERPPGPIRLGWTLLFSDNLVWQSVDNNSVTGAAGSHSGTNRVLRIVGAGDVYPRDVLVQEYEATFVLNAVQVLRPPPLDPLPLAAGQVTVRGVFFTNRGGTLVEEKRFAITGGTGHYHHARGYGIEAGAARTLEIDL